jgi:hypothetical protein
VLCLVLGTAVAYPQQSPPASGLKEVFSTLSEGEQPGEVETSEQAPYTTISNITEVNSNYY